MKGVRQADDLFCLFWCETKQRPELEISTRLEVGKGMPVREELEKGTQRRFLAKSDGEGQSTTDSRREQSAWDRVQEQWGKTSQDESAFPVALWKFREGYTSVLVYRCTGNAVSRNHPSCTLSWPKPLLFVCSFVLPLPQLYSCDYKEMCDDPIGTTRWITSQDRIVSKKLMSTGGREG